jgi:hypothetical protein
MKKEFSIRLVGVSAMALLYAADTYGENGPGATVPRTEYERLKQEVQLLKDQMRMLMDERAKAAGVQPTPPAKPAPGAPAQAERRQAAKPATRENELALQEGDREKEAEKAKQDLDQFLRRQKVLFQSGELQLEFNTAYIHDTVEITPVKSKFRSVNANVFARYGLADDVELDLSVPYVFAEQEVDPSLSRIATNPPQRFERRDHSGLGDVNGALRWAALHEEGMIPETTVSLTVKSDTGDIERNLGTGFWTLGAGVSLVKTIDPVVFFGSLGYTAVLEKNAIDPGDQIPYSLGMGFSLNDRVSFSTSLAGTALLRTEVNGREIPGSGADLHSLNFAVTIQLARHVFFEPFVNFGLTEESTDFVAGINIPFRLEDKYPIPFFQ